MESYAEATLLILASLSLYPTQSTFMIKSAYYSVLAH